MREALYLLSVLACTWANPAFLLVDVGASVRDTVGAVKGYGGYVFLAMYVLAPEKFVASAAFEGGHIYLITFGGVLLDLCGVGALVAMLAGGELITALAVGYAATALGGLWVLVGVIGIMCGCCD